jgi:uncharacterized delta-60 repeat protein
MREHLVWSLAAVMCLAAASAWGAAGGPDPSFGTNGIVIAPVLEYSYAETVVRLPDGRLLVGGEAGQRAGLRHRDMMLAQFDTDGTPDATFGTDGVVVTVVGTRNGIVKQVMRRPDGKIVTAGTLDEQSPGADVVLARYEADGTPDATFGTDGIKVVDIGGIERTTSAALLADGKIVVAGNTRQAGLPGGADGMVLRFDDAGELDGTFGTGGAVLLDDGGRYDEINDMLIEPSGRIILAGWASDPTVPFTGASVGIVEALSDVGAPDATFGTDGVTQVSVDVRSRVAQIIRLSDGDLFMQAGGSPGDGTGYSVLARMNGDGTFESAFGGGDGIISPSSYLMFALTAMPDDRPLGAGPGFLWGHWGAIGAMRMLADGSPDASFGNDGRASLYPVTGDYFNGGSVAMVADPDGSAVTIAGFFSPVPIQDDQSRQLALARILLEGTACTADADCGACERCGTGGVCERGPRSGCVRPDFRGAKLSYAGYPVKPKIQWKWRSGVTLPFFDPATDDLSLCMWWGDRLPIYESTIPAGSAWTTIAAGSKFKDRAGSNFGIQQVTVGRKKIFLKAKGDGIAANPNGFPDALLQPADDSIDFEVQMHASNGACLAATYPQSVFTTTYPQHVRSGVGR